MKHTPVWLQILATALSILVAAGAVVWTLHAYVLKPDVLAAVDTRVKTSIAEATPALLQAVDNLIEKRIVQHADATVHARTRDRFTTIDTALEKLATKQDVMRVENQIAEIRTLIFSRIGKAIP